MSTITFKKLQAGELYKSLCDTQRVSDLAVFSKPRPHGPDRMVARICHGDAFLCVDSAVLLVREGSGAHALYTWRCRVLYKDAVDYVFFYTKTKQGKNEPYMFRTLT